MVGPSTILYFETRSDSKSGQRGYAFGVYGSGGVALSLDWISRESSWLLHEASGVKKYYLTFEYSLLKSIGSEVEFNNSGLSIGLTFEI